MKNSGIQQPTAIKVVVINSDRSKPTFCCICEQKMGTPHQCKRCKRMICEKCSQHRVKIYENGEQSKNPHKICLLCFDDRESIKKSVETQKIIFGKDSLSKEWLNTYCTDPKSCQQNYIKAKESAKQKPGTLIDLDPIMIDINKMINYSLKDFIMSITVQLNADQQKQILLSIIDTLIRNYPEIGFSPDLAVITYFLLCFSSEASTYILLTILYGYVLPSTIYPKNVQQYKFESEIELIKSTVVAVSKINEFEQNLVQNYLNDRIIRFLPTLGINFFEYSTQLFILNCVFQNQRNYSDLLKCFAAVFTNHILDIKNNAVNFNLVEVSILRQLKMNSLSQSYMFCKKIQTKELESKPTLNMNVYDFNKQIADKPSIDKDSYISLMQESKQLKESNNKLQIQLNNKSEEIQELKYAVEECELREVKLKEEIEVLKGVNQKLQETNENIKVENTLYRESNSEKNNHMEKDLKIELLLKQNRQLQEKLEKYEEQNENQDLDKQRKILEEQALVLQTKYNESNIDKQNLIEVIDSQKLQIERLNEDIQSRKVELVELSEVNIRLKNENGQLEKRVETLQFEMSLKESMKGQEDYEQVLRQEMSRINEEFEKQQVIVNELNAEKMVLERKIVEQQREYQQRITVFEDRVVSLNQKILKLEGVNQQLIVENAELVKQKDDRINELQEQFTIMQIENERQYKKIVEQSEKVDQVMILQEEKQQLERSLKKSVFEIEQLKLLIEQSADTGSMEYQNSIAHQLQQKNDEITLLSDLNNELMRKAEQQDSKITEMEVEIKNLQKAMKQKISSEAVKVLELQNREMQMQLDEQREIQNELLESLKQAPQQVPQYFQFGESKVQTKAKDPDDALNVIETRTFQNQILKGLLSENQQQVQRLTQTLDLFKSILTRPPRYSVIGIDK